MNICLVLNLIVVYSLHTQTDIYADKYDNLKGIMKKGV